MANNRTFRVLITDEGTPQAGLSPILKIMRDADKYFLDFSDATFKASGWTNIDADMDEPDGTNAAGLYNDVVDLSGFNDGQHTLYVYESTIPFVAIRGIYIENGDVVEIGATKEIEDATDIPAEATMRQMITLIYEWLRNDSQTSTTERKVANDAGSVTLESDMVKVAGTSFNQGKLGNPD